MQRGGSWASAGRAPAHYPLHTIPCTLALPACTSHQRGLPGPPSRSGTPASPPVAPTWAGPARPLRLLRPRRLLRRRRLLQLPQTAGESRAFWARGSSLVHPAAAAALAAAAARCPLQRWPRYLLAWALRHRPGPGGGHAAPVVAAAASLPRPRRLRRPPQRVCQALLPLPPARHRCSWLPG